MLAPFINEIQQLAFIYVHTGFKLDKNNRIYSVAAAIIDQKGAKQNFNSLVHYEYLTSREYYKSNISQKMLHKAPMPDEVMEKINKFIENQEIIFCLDDHGIINEVRKFCKNKRIIDLSFAAEFFLCNLKSYSIKNLWEYIFSKTRKKLSFSAKEIVELSIELVRHICSKELGDKHCIYAPAIRYFLKQSNALFGKVFIHICKNYQKYFGGLFSPYTNSDTENWAQFLEKSKKVSKEDRSKKTFCKISLENIDNLYKGMSNAGNGFRLRPEQVSYASHVSKALNENAVLTIEAGTGTGKTQGYLVPVMEFLRVNPNSHVVISTYTKSLQEQIYQQEVAITKELVPAYKNIQTALLKGKSSYICAEKLDYIYDNNLKGQWLLAWLYCLNIVFKFRNSDVDSIGEKVKYYLNTGHVLHQMLNEVSAGTGCTPRHTRCPAQVITSEAKNSNLIITNHHKLALLDRDAVLSGIFTNYIIDEANHFETAVRNAFGTEIISRDIKATLDYLEAFSGRVLKRAANEHEKAMLNLIKNIKNIRTLIQDFRNLLITINPKVKFSSINMLPYDHPIFGQGVLKIKIDAIQEALNIIKKPLKLIKDEDACRMLKIQKRTSKRVETAIDQLTDYADSFKIIENNIKHENNITAYQIFSKNWNIITQWVRVDDLIRQEIHEKKNCVIYTAATICHKGSFENFQQITGMVHPNVNIDNNIKTKEFRYARIPSPFSTNAMEIIIPDEAVSGKYDNKDTWINSIIKILPDLIKQNKGRTLVLFSSYQDLNTIAQKVSQSIADTRYPLLIQKPGQPTINLCDEFRAIKESILFGVDTFWYGVDFKGDTLTQVIITRIPYPPPRDPVQMARKKIMHPKEFWNRYQYDMEIKMKQGIGRLIRCDTDKGRVVILDSRYRV